MRLVLLCFAIACAPKHGDTQSAAADEILASDLEVLCHRVEERSVGAWSQAALQSDDLTALTIRVDGQEPAARCELGRLMRQHARAKCRDVSRNLVRSCKP